MFEKLKALVNFRPAQYHAPAQYQAVTVTWIDTRRFFFRARGYGWQECTEQAYRALQMVGWDIDLAEMN